jgi:C4-type Zn-finger protein
MASPILDQLTAQVTETTGVEQSAITLIEGIQARIDAAVQQVLDNGATAEQLQPISDLSTAMETQTQALAAAIQAQGG